MGAVWAGGQKTLLCLLITLALAQPSFPLSAPALRLRGGSAPATPPPMYSAESTPVGSFGVLPAAAEAGLEGRHSDSGTGLDADLGQVKRSDSQAPMQLLHSLHEREGTDSSLPHKYIILISDKTGFTASHVLTAALYQFAALSNRTTTQVFSNIKTWRHIDRIISLAGRIDGFVCFTLTDPELRNKTVARCESSGVQWVDVLGSMLDSLSSYVGLKPSMLGTASGEGEGSKRKPLSSSYFTRIEAVDFAIRQDDGNLLKNLARADIVLIGISRVQKTPLSMYLAQQFGLKVANFRIHLGEPIPPELFEVEPRRVFVLFAHQDYIFKVRRRRLELVAESADPGDDTTDHMQQKIKVSKGYQTSDYADIEYIKKELDYCRELVVNYSEWRSIDMTGVSVEEMADHHILPYLPRKPSITEAALEALSCNFCIVKVDNNEIERYDPEIFGQDPDALNLTRSGSRDNLELLSLGADERWTSEMAVMYASDGLSTLTGIPKHELLSPNVVDLFQRMSGKDTDIATMRQVITALFAGKERTHEVTCYRADGSDFINEIHVAPVNNAAGQVVLFVVSMRQKKKEDPQAPEPPLLTSPSVQNMQEQTEGTREQAQRAMDRTRRQTFYTIFDATSERMPLWYASKGFFKMTGYARDDVLGKGTTFSVWGDFFAGGGEASHAATQLQTLKLDETDVEEVVAVKAAMQAGKTVNTCVKSYRKDGHAFWNYAHLQPVHSASGALKYYVGSHHAVY
uniref:PAS domain-containing protein n=1 Tax=Hemiselmis andersenii TaxID=464988 RepID=A0A6U2FPY2_HEMAN|mmetsp:Transcript_33114/g.77516  ORF Transcript_33114/g.77516 Transcript_33114/m.77516 type:complete len:743 (+) Transcript_33114:171-2399(+)